MDRWDLARLIMMYDSDGPHFDLEQSEQYYPEVTIGQLREYLAEKHCGDCTNMPMTCMRCFAEDALHQADWLLDRLHTGDKEHVRAEATADST